MKVVSGSPYRRILLLVLLAVLSGFFAISFFILPSFIGLTWNGYYTVLLDRAVDIRAAAARLESLGLEDFLCSATAEVEFSDFDIMERVSVSDLPARLHPEDPRLDDYLKGVGELFVSGSGKEHILYFPARQSPLALAKKLKAAFGGSAWSMVDWNLGRRLILLFLYLLIVGILTFRNRGMRGLTLSFAVPWLNFFVHGSMEGFVAGVLLYLGTMFFLEEALPLYEQYLYYSDYGFRLRNLKDRSIYFGFVGLCAVFLVLYPEGDVIALLPLVFGLCGSGTLAAGLALYGSWKRERTEHRLFIPLSILPKGWRGGGPGRRTYALAAVFCLLLFVPGVLRFTEKGEKAVVIPKPVSVPGIHGFSREDLKALWLFHREDTLPDFSDYVSHRAFQEGFFYGYPQKFPLQDARITLSRFTEENGGIRRTEETVAKYDEAWYKGVLKSAKQSGIEGFLYRQGSKGVVLEPAGRIMPDTAFFIRHGVGVTLVFLPLLFASFGIAPGFVPYLKSLELRRKQQEA